MITVDPGSSIQYIAELCLMTPYHYLVTLESESHWTHVLRIDMNSPDLIVREVKDPAIRGIFRSLNEVYPIGSRKPNSRYMGEILRVTNLHEVVQSQQAREFRFFSADDTRRMELPGNIAITKPSPSSARGTQVRETSAPAQKKTREHARSAPASSASRVSGSRPGQGTLPPAEAGEPNTCKASSG